VASLKPETALVWSSSDNKERVLQGLHPTLQAGWVRQTFGRHRGSKQPYLFFTNKRKIDQLELINVTNFAL
jgi:hypothetical protein